MSEAIASSDSTYSASLGHSQAERVVNTFLSPTRTFKDILRNTSWWLPFLLATLLSMATAYVIDRQVGYDTVVQNTLHDSPSQEERIAKLEPAQRAAQLHGMAAGYRYTSFASPVFILAFSALGALVLWASFNFGLGANTTYSQMFAVWMYASLPRLFTSILMMLTLTFGGNAEAFNLKNPIGTNLAFYLPDAAPWLRSMLSFLDVIGLWVLVLLVIGTAIVAKVKRGQAAAIVVGWWALMLVLTGAVAGLTS